MTRYTTTVLVGVAVAAAALAVPACAAQAERVVRDDASAWEQVAPGVWTRVEGGWRSVRVHRAEGEAWLRERLEAELAQGQARREARPDDRRVALHVQVLQRRLAHLSAPPASAAPAPDLPPGQPPGTYCNYVDGAVVARASNGTQPGARASAVGKRCNAGSIYAEVTACDSYECSSAWDSDALYAYAWVQEIGTGPRGCAGESYADNGLDVFWLQKTGFSCW